MLVHFQGSDFGLLLSKCFSGQSLLQRAASRAPLPVEPKVLGRSVISKGDKIDTTATVSISGASIETDSVASLTLGNEAANKIGQQEALLLWMKQRQPSK